MLFTYTQAMVNSHVGQLAYLFLPVEPELIVVWVFIGVWHGTRGRVHIRWCHTVRISGEVCVNMLHMQYSSLWQDKTLVASDMLLTDDIVRVLVKLLGDERSQAKIFNLLYSRCSDHGFN